MTQTIQSQEKGILMSEAAIKQVLFLREKQGKDLCLRVGVRQGGCSGMSYIMDFADPSTIRKDDEVFDYNDPVNVFTSVLYHVARGCKSL